MLRSIASCVLLTSLTMRRSRLAYHGIQALVKTYVAKNIIGENNTFENNLGQATPLRKKKYIRLVSREASHD